MRAFSRKKRLSRLIPKNHFCSNSVFRSEPLVSWTYTEAVLFTAYDFHRSECFWIDELVNSGMTLKEGLVELGFPKNVKLLADTGVFEMEARKAGISAELGIDVDVELTISQILEAYEISGGDFFVAPDEIILPLDKPDVAQAKVETIKENLVCTLEVIRPGNVMGVIQGIQKRFIDDLLDFYKSNHVTKYALGGMIPLYHHDKQLLSKTVAYVRNSTRRNWLHAFGLPRSGLIQYYLHDMLVDSVDTSLLLYLSAR